MIVYGVFLGREGVAREEFMGFEGRLEFSMSVTSVVLRARRVTVA
jgi:hypothetical protein